MTTSIVAAEPLAPANRPGDGRERRRLVPAVPLAVLGVLVLLGLLAPWLTSYSPLDGDLNARLVPPAWLDGGSAAHLLGTDTAGRDVLTRLLYGIRTSLLVVVLALAVAVVVGTTVGVVSGFFGGWVDGVLMRLVDVALSVPPILLALSVAVAVGASFRSMILILGFLVWPGIARLIRAETLSLRRGEFVRYARAVGLSRRWVMGRHILPNILPTLLVATTLEVATVIMTEAALGFLGAGVPPPQPSWGVMIEEGSALIATGWWIALFPGLAIVATVICTNALGDWLRDHLDPRTRGSRAR